jgi:hypothetical protein
MLEVAMGVLVKAMKMAKEAVKMIIETMRVL